jgi:hypothetical protein
MSLKFESMSRLSRIGKQAFAETGLIEIVIPSSVDLIGADCFVECRLLSSITYEAGSRFGEVD